MHSFECLVVFLREKPIIAVTKRCLQRIHLLSTFRHGSPPLALAPEHVNVRVFLAAYMIAYRPTHVFESMGALETQLYESSLPLLHTFEQIAKCIIADPKGCFGKVSYETSEHFPTYLFEFLKRFKAWKVPDEVKLTCRIKHALVALYQAQGQLPEDEPDDSKLKVEFFTQIARLRSKLQQIAGANAVSEFDEQRGAGNVRVAIAGVSTGAGAYASLPGRMTNEQLAHELLLDPVFQLDDSGGDSVENPVYHRIRQGFHRAFWDSLEDDLKLVVPCYVRVVRVIIEIRDGLQDLMAGRGDMSISRIIDIDHIQQQVSAQAIAWSDCMHLVASIVGIIRRGQAPKRDDETQQKWVETGRLLLAADRQPEGQPRALCSALEFLLDRVNVMRIDAANARLRLISPVIRDHGIDYERGKFRDKLNAGELTLDRTEVCVSRVLTNASSYSCTDDPSIRLGFLLPFGS